MTVTAFDSHGFEFDQEQYLMMDFELEIEMTGIHKSRGLLAVHSDSDRKMFEVTGVEPGNYVVTAYIESQKRPRDGSRITSEACKIEVFPILELYPSTLLLTPNMRYTLNVLGGPSRGSYGKSIEGSHVEIKFDVEDKEIATIDSFRDITAKTVGDTVLFYNII